MTKKEIREAKRKIRMRLIIERYKKNILFTEAANMEFYETLRDKVNAEFEKEQKTKDKAKQ